MDEDDKMTLRDKFAIEALQSLMLREYNYETKDFVLYFDHAGGKLKTDTNNKMERLIRAAYTIADLMRKVRQTAFE